MTHINRSTGIIHLFVYLAPMPSPYPSIYLKQMQLFGSSQADLKWHRFDDKWVADATEAPDKTGQTRPYYTEPRIAYLLFYVAQRITGTW